MSKAAARQLVAAFRNQEGRSRWKHVDRGALADGLDKRIERPDRIDQRYAPLCGPASFVRAVAIHRPVEYAKAGIDLWNTGKARIGDLDIEPGGDLLNDPIGGDTDAADWVLLASVRDSSNWLLSMSGLFGASLAGITTPDTIESWLRQAGFRDVVRKTHLLLGPSDERMSRYLDQANRLYLQGAYVFLFVNAGILATETQHNKNKTTLGIANHWVVMNDMIRHGGDLDTQFSMWAWSWGQTVRIPQSPAEPITRREFLDQFQGYIAARP